ncbi:NAD(P)/FAD-dependent oxidoreductase [Hydrogenophaga borbori]|jgi:3-phenylpropionate/trans-cinnamate dioxygenase ferredoxin reductase subunit
MTEQATPVVVVGGGLAGISFASALRQGGYSGPLTLVGEESEAPYDRPPLSKAFLKDADEQKIRLDVSRLADVDVLRGVRADAIELAARSLRLSDGQRLPWGTLVLATGARARDLPALQGTARPVFTLRTMDDARRLREALKPGCKVLLVGAGVIGLELAATASELGGEVTVVEAQPRVMARSVPATLSAYVQQRHLAAGAQLHLSRRIVACFDGGVELDDGTRVPTDLVVAGIGVQSNDELAQAAGIRCNDGVEVDGFGRSSAPGVLAIGDVARQVEPVSGQVMRIETWSNAQMQGAAAARAWLDASAPPYAENPWFWSDQYELRIQGVGMPAGERELVRGDVASGRFALLQFNGDRLVGAACVNNARDFGALRRLVGRRFDATDAQWADTADLRKIA